MPADNRSGRDQDERLLPPGPKASQHDPKQLLPHTQSSPRSLGVKREQLLAESEVFQNHILTGTEGVDNPTEPWRRRKIMAGILSKDFATSVAQVTHSTRVRSFDKGQHLVERVSDLRSLIRSRWLLVSIRAHPSRVGKLPSDHLRGAV